MKIEMLKTKLHRATITDANLNYQGSITIDKNLLKIANLRKGQKVEIANINNGERFSTYIIEGRENSGTICLNGAAARKAQIDDLVIIMAYGIYDEKELESYAPDVFLLDSNNKIISHTKDI